MMKLSGQFPAGLPSGKVNLAVQRPTVNVREAENVGEEMAAAAAPKGLNPQPLTFSKHGTFNTSRQTHPGIEQE